jgi:hypothetical protein
MVVGRNLEALQGEVLVLDTEAPFVYIGTLDTWDELYLRLVDADVHDMRDSKTSRELYVIETRRLGVRSNRQAVLVARSHVVSLSRLADVLAY